MTLVVLHLSDLHFGPHSRFAAEEPQALAERFCEEVRRALALHERASPDLVLMTGDLTEAARKPEFEDAARYFETMVGSLGVSRSRFCFVPGNHDVSWAHCKRVRIDQEIEEFDEAELERRLQTEKMSGWERFLSDFYGDQAGARSELAPGVVIHDYPSLRLSVGALDSCRRETELAHGGVLSREQVQALMNEWQREERRAWLKLAAVHHNPVADNEDNLRGWAKWLGEEAESKSLRRSAIEHFVADATGFEGKSLLHNLAEDAQLQLVLHGHVHAAGHTPWSWRRGVKGQTQVVGAGSLFLAENKLPGEQPVMFQLLHLDPQARELRIQRRVWEPRARAPGQVDSGSFVEDPASPAAGLVLDIGLPEGFVVEQEVAPAQPQQAISQASFLAEYRMRLRGRHRTWELGAVHMGARRPATPALDDMYVPLRLGARRERADERSQGSGGGVITPYRLMQRHQNLLIRGAAGSGKTTWMRWSFRRLLERDDALPILIELRELARQWSLPGVTGRQRNFDWWLEQWVERFVGGGWSAGLRAALDAKAGPRPVLMVDGWDELGDLGREFREQFDGFLVAHPRVLAIATSRPYGEQVPEHDERFETVEVMPLSDGEVEGLTRRFFAKVHGESEADLEDEVGRFLRALDGAEQAKSLGRTPLLLVMMLIIGRGRPLPDRRHKLYEFCVEQLLDAHPSKRARDGAQVASWQWAPEGYDPRLRAVAKLALWMHENHGASAAGRAAVAKRDELLAQLPAAWSGTQREGFLAWLVASSGLMVDYSDETLSFAHLGFQEYLAAWQLEVACEGDAARIERATQLCRDNGWWETLRLWAALIEGRASERLRPVMRELIRMEREGFWLAGAILADGLGEDCFEPWCAGLSVASFGLIHDAAKTAADAWAISRQRARRASIAEQLRAQVERADWLEWWSLARWWHEAKLDGRFNYPLEHTPAGIIVRSAEKLSGAPDSPAARVAWGRVWLGSSPLWCGKQLPLLALRLWPTRRMWTGYCEQLQRSLSNPSEDELLVPREPRDGDGDGDGEDEDEEDRVQTLVGMLRLFASWGLLERELWLQVERIAHCHTHRVVSGVFDDGRLRPLSLVRELGDSHRMASSLARAHARYFARGRSRLRPSETSWSFAGTRAMFAAAADEDPFIQLFARACQLSLLNASPDADFERRLHSFEGDPLWPALARHLARASTAEDRARLEGAVREPDRYEGDLGLALRYWVRGDVMHEDGSTQTLEQLGVELPLLDELEMELDLLELMPELDRSALTQRWSSWPAS